MTEPRPPRLARWLLRARPLGSRRAEVEADLAELFALRAHARGTSYACWRCYGDVLSLWRIAPDGARGLREVQMISLQPAWRRAIKSPGFALLIVLVLGIGIGLSAAVFNIVNGVVLRPLPYPHAERLVWLWGTSPRFPTASVTPGDYRSYRELAQSFEQLAASYATNVDVSTDTEPQRVAGASVSWNYFTALGVRPALGRTFTRDDERHEMPPVAIVSHGLWHRLFGGDQQIVGRRISLDRRPVTVVGVMPARFRPPVVAEAEVWLPLPTAASDMASRSSHFLRPIGLLRRDVSLADAQRELNAVAKGLEAEFPDTNEGWTATIVPLHDAVIGRTADALGMLWIIVGCVLLLACANAAGLLMAGVIARQREFAVRLALGASRLGVIQQVLIEALMLALLGGVLGVAIADWGVQLLLAIAPSALPFSGQIQIDVTVVVFIFALTTITALVSGLPPAMQACKARQHDMLHETRATVGPAARRTFRTFVVVEFALALILVSTAALMIRTFLSLSSRHPGFRVEGLVTGEMALSPIAYPSTEQRVAFWERLLERLNRVPGVLNAASVSQLPLSGQANDWYFYPEGQPPAGPDEMVTADFRRVSAAYFATMDIPVKRGRRFTVEESRTSAKVMAISESLAARYLTGKDPIGLRLMVDWPNPEPYEIVGIVGDVRHRSMATPPFPTMYVPDLNVSFANIVLQAADEEAVTVNTLRQVVASVDRNQPVAHAGAMSHLIGESLAPARFVAYLLTSFGAIALALAGVGTFGVMAFSVARRTRDIGIQIALGARPHAVRTMVLREGVWLALGGLALGVPGVLVANRIFGSLFRVTLTHTPVVAASVILLVVTAVLACYIPARRATRIDPVTALRQE